MPTRSTLPIRFALAFNFMVSSACAAALLAASAAIAQALGDLPAWLMTALGMGLAAFAVLIGSTLLRIRASSVLLISALDLLWVLVSLPLVLIPGLLSSQGVMVVLGVAGVTCVAAIWQLYGVKTMLRAPEGEPNTFRHCVSLQSAVPADVLWPVVRKLDSISLYSDGLKSSHMESGDGADPQPGAVRVCTHTNGQNWSEELIAIDDAERSLVLRFCSEADDFPFPFRNVSGGWTVRPRKGGGSTVEVWWRVTPLQRRLGWLVLAVATLSLDQDVRGIVGAMESGRTRVPRRIPGLPPMAYC